MTLLDRLLGRPQPRRAKAVTALGPWATGIPLSLYTTEPDEKAAAYLKAFKVGWFYKAGSKIADDVAALEWTLSDGDKEEGETEATLDRPPLQTPFDSLGPIDQLQRLLEAPLVDQNTGRILVTGRQLFRKTQVRLDFAGAAAWYLEGATSGLPTAIMGISPARLWPARDRNNQLIGWILDRRSPTGGTPFDVSEILWFSTGNAEEDDDIWGTSVVESVYSQVPLTDQIAQHTSTTLSLGGRLSGMLWPKERALEEGEYLDAQRAWRNVASDPNAARRMLIFPEPMEWSQGAATPEEIGLPELAALNRDEILTAFPISPYRLGVPMPGGLNSGEVRRQDRKDYWEETIHPRADLLSEVIQVGLVSRYEEATGQTFDFEMAEPNLDDAPSLMEKTAAYKGLVSIGLDPKEALNAVGLNHIKWLGLPMLLDPAQQAAAAQEAQQTTVRDASPGGTTTTSQTIVGKATKAREDIARSGVLAVSDFLAAQRDRVVAKLEATLPSSKAARRDAVKSPDWWDAAFEDAQLANVLQLVYIDASRQGLQTVADGLNRIVPNKAVQRVTDDLLTYGGERISDMNATTLEAITTELAEGTRRGYSIAQLIDGVPTEGFAGVKSVGLSNGVPAWGDARAEMIARTETALSYNRATLSGYREFRVQQVQAIDGDKDEECADRDGRIFSVDDALDVADHPNGTLDWAPVIDKAAHSGEEEDMKPEEVRAVIAEVLAAQKAAQPAQPQIISLTPQISFNPTIHVPDAPTPVIHNEVKVPEIKIPEITIPEQPTPIVTVKAAAAKAPEVQNIRIIESPARVHRRTVQRDKRGQVTEVIEQSADLE